MQIPNVSGGGQGSASGGSSAPAASGSELQPIGPTPSNNTGAASPQTPTFTSQTAAPAAQTPSPSAQSQSQFDLFSAPSTSTGYSTGQSGAGQDPFANPQGGVSGSTYDGSYSLFGDASAQNDPFSANAPADPLAGGSGAAYGASSYPQTPPQTPYSSTPYDSGGYNANNPYQGGYAAAPSSPYGGGYGATQQPAYTYASSNPYASPQASAGYGGSYGGHTFQGPPHRGGTVLTLGILGIVLSCCPIAGFACSIPAWTMAQNDLAEMDRGYKDPSGRGLTTAGKVLGIIGVVVSFLSFLINAALNFADFQREMMN